MMRNTVKNMMLLGLSALVVSCATTGTGTRAVGITSSANQPGEWKKVAGVSNTVSGAREVMKAKVHGKEVVAVLQWRPYNTAMDGMITKWYGDMGSPPPRHVVQSLLISVDGRGLMVPASKTRYLCSQWMNDPARMGLYLKGGNLCVYLDLGDGAESWTASYIVNPATAALVAHYVDDGPTFHNAVNQGP